MSAYADREFFIPIQLRELIDFLVDGRGAKIPGRTLRVARRCSFGDLPNWFNHNITGRFTSDFAT